MMKSSIFYILICLTYVSCNRTEKRESIDMRDKIEWEVDSSMIQQKSNEDNLKLDSNQSTFENVSLRNPDHKAYLADLSFYEIGKLILKDKAQPMDNEVTFTLMDTISSCDLKFLGFYLGVFENIMSKSDGALSEAVGLYTLEFIRKRPQVFVSHMDTTNVKNIVNWANYTSSEMYFDHSEDSLVFYCHALLNELKKIDNNEGLLIFEKNMLSSAESIK